MLARAAAATAGATFLNVSASSLTSKWRGESEKAVRALFALARHNAPCVVFLDECDAFMDRRGGDDSGDGGGGGKHEHEASRRVKSEFLMRMDGLAEDAMSGVLVLAATNLPWELDRALLRRLERPDKHWKYNPKDLDERALWSEYDVAYGEALARTSRDFAPWYAIPADDKPFMRLTVARLLVAALQDLDLRWPDPDPDDVAGYDAAKQALRTELGG